MLAPEYRCAVGEYASTHPSVEPALSCHDVVMLPSKAARPGENIEVDADSRHPEL